MDAIDAGQSADALPKVVVESEIVVDDTQTETQGIDPLAENGQQTSEDASPDSEPGVPFAPGADEQCRAVTVPEVKRFTRAEFRAAVRQTFAIDLDDKVLATAFPLETTAGPIANDASLLLVSSENYYGIASVVTAIAAKSAGHADKGSCSARCSGAPG